ncbi:MAG: TonB-dependent receptor plug domain-containing protein [Gammaproteobacteria bacterium]|nr:TonB-dependent receptor plug domain-containing protein [Gammaproteobacteria bacterium]MBT5203933.1 TonB-dependent receptor plug domain-containing protein [Gammaproteobacteria bacterium]MBT5603155.1 TonB-dependent receptor plug domain-containing protein [Gammaproteobacteria bacterium]MBT6246632.1 TonB-dependent receptor plug domain-containing protein [Gammaproteobacteria bacterium]
MNIIGPKLLSLAAVFALVAVGNTAVAESEMEEVIVKGDLGSLPGERVESTFGFDKSVLETPRSLSTISEEMMDRFNMQDIDELIVVSPGSFTQSFFGVAGGLDVRGTPGETYFRGVRRLDNPGNYPTPIGASDRVDIVRGPASPIYGPAKIGGYLNFNPKSARVEETGSYIEENTGAMSYTAGSWDKSVLTAEIGGPAELGGKPMGFYLYGELENSGSFYSNAPGVEQSLVQASFDMDLSDNVRIQFGGMYHDYKGAQNAGWNRLTQDLIDNGTYITGVPLPLDTNGDGKISHQEFDVTGDGFTDLNPFAWWVGALGPDYQGTFEEFIQPLGPFDMFDRDLMALQNVGTAILDPSVTLIAADDKLENQVTTLYFDVIIDAESGWRFKNQLFYEGYENLNENAYGFSQFHDSYVIEDKLVISRVFESDSLTTSIQFSPSIRFTDFAHGDDYTNEYFHRRDLTGPSTALDARLLATRIDDDYTEYYLGEYTDIGIAFLADLTWQNGLSVLFGARYDSIDMESRQIADKLLLASSNNFCTDGSCIDLAADNDVSGVSWTFSLSYEIGDTGVIPYVTMSEQATVIAGQGAELTVSNVASGGAFDTSDLTEYGIKGQVLDSRLYFSLSSYEQERTDFSAQSIVTNQAVRTEGTEFEVRWSVNESLLLGMTYTHIEAVNLASIENGRRFSFFGAEDLPNIDPWLLWGGQVGGNISVEASGGARAGMPENIFSVYGTYSFGNGFSLSASVADVESVASSFSNGVILPAYTLLNLSLGWESEKWNMTLSGKNLTDERYFRANFPNLFGAAIVLPELPRHYQAKLQYRF